MPQIDFDFAGALPLARELYYQSNRIRRKAFSRQRAAETALADWAGPHADTFKIAMMDQDKLAETAMQQLRDDADAWAQAWADAMNAENQRRYQDAVEQARDEQSWGEAASEWLFGDGIPDSVGAAPQPMRAPFAPSYWTTGEFWHG